MASALDDQSRANAHNESLGEDGGFGSDPSSFPTTTRHSTRHLLQGVWGGRGYKRHLQIKLTRARNIQTCTPTKAWSRVYAKASHKNIVYTTDAVEDMGTDAVFNDDGTNVFHFVYEDDSDCIILELFNMSNNCIGESRVWFTELAELVPEQHPEEKALPVMDTSPPNRHQKQLGELVLTAQMKRQRDMDELSNLHVVLHRGRVEGLTSVSKLCAKLIYKHATYTSEIPSGIGRIFYWLEENAFTFIINSWKLDDVLKIQVCNEAGLVGECKILLSVFINLEGLRADPNKLVLRTENLLVNKRPVGSIEVAAGFTKPYEPYVLGRLLTPSTTMGTPPEFYPPTGSPLPPRLLTSTEPWSYSSSGSTWSSTGSSSHSASETGLLPSNSFRIPSKLGPVFEIEGYHQGYNYRGFSVRFLPDITTSEMVLVGGNTGIWKPIRRYLQIDLTRDLLGASSTGYVIRTTFINNREGWVPCALKRINTTDDKPPDLKRLRHPHVVHFFDYWSEKTSLHGEVREWMPNSAFMLFLVMELMDGDLAKLMTSIKETGVTPFSLIVAVDIMLQIAKGMLYLHEMGVSHPHLKCDNVLCRVDSKASFPFRLGDVHVKLGGFGCSRTATVDTKNQDVFCFGLTCLEILTGNECSEDITFENKVSRPIIPESTPSILRDCIASCLDTRIVFSEVVTLLLLAADQIAESCENDEMLYSKNLHIESAQTHNRDIASSSTPKSDSQEAFHVHQLHPQLGEVPTSAQMTVIFFHGFPKVSEEWKITWRTRDNKLVWPQMWLPEDLGGDIRVLCVSFDDHLNMSSNQSIKDLLRSLVNSATWKLGETKQAIVLVGHSFGGVIIKALVTEAQSLAGKTVESDVDFQEVMKCKNFLKCLASIVFYSVPHALTNTEFEDYISGCSNTRVLQRSSLLKALRKDGDFVREMVQLSRDFESEVPQTTKVLAFLEGQPMNKRNFLVTEKSCQGRFLSLKWHKVHKDNHFEVCRPDSKSHDGYKILLNHLQQLMLSPASQTINDVPGTVKRQKMKGLYEGTTVQLVRMTRELMSSLNSARGTKRKETMRELRMNIRNMKILVYGDSEAGPVPEACAQLTLDMFHEDFMRLLIQYFPILDLDVGEDLAQVVASLQRQQVAADYLNKNKDLLDLLVAGYDHPDMASQCGAILRECVRHQSIAQYVLDSQQNLSKFFKCVEFIDLEIASNAVATLEELLTRHNSTVVDYLDKNYDWFFSEYNSKLLAIPHFISRRQMVKLLGHILSSRVNVNVMRRYVSSKDNMVMLMNLLLDPTVQIEAFRVFKAFVINENKPPEIVSILVANRSRLLRFFNNFKTEKVDVQFDQDKAQVVKEIASLSMKMDLKPSPPT